MNSIVKGSVAGLVATMVITILMIIKTKMGLLPELDINIISNKLGSSPAIGWLACFIAGIIIYGVGFSFIKNLLPARHLRGKGIILGILGWLVTMLLLMPIMGYDYFGINIGLSIPPVTMVLHIVFGAVLGMTYRRLSIH